MLLSLGPAAVVTPYLPSLLLNSPLELTTALMVEQTVDTTTPLVFSLLAGLSTCLGAAVVFVKRDMTHKHMTFSLSLAGSVMTTVSFVSILPETFSTTQALPERIASFLLGCLLYFVVSKFALPEPDSILGLNNDDDVGDQAYTRVSREEQGALLYEEHDPEEATSPSTHRFRRHRSGNSVPSFEEENKPFHDGVNGITNYNKFEKETWSWKAFSAGRDLATDDARRAWRVSLLLFVSLAVHNFPEVSIQKGKKEPKKSQIRYGTHCHLTKVLRSDTICHLSIIYRVLPWLPLPCTASSLE